VSLLVVLAALTGCTPSCEEVCDKLVACENEGTERMSSAECQESCNDQHALYNEEWDDGQKRDAFDAHLSCLYESECADVEAGTCYDEEIWSY
jgi:hypothetical protein